MKILYNARIHTLDIACPLATAIAIDRGRILAVGKEDELLSSFPEAEKQDMGEQYIFPGLTDAHFHLEQYALSLKKIDCETGTLEECLRRVEKRVRDSRPGDWILGHGWNQNTWGKWPSAAALDEVSANTPIYLTAKSLHAAWANTAALRQAEITGDTHDPGHGKIQRDVAGQPTGILLEEAMGLINKIIPEQSVDAVSDAIEQVQPVLWRLGLTGVHDFDHRTCFMALQKLHKKGMLKLRVTKGIPLDDLSHAVALGLRTGFGDDWLRIGSLKGFMDGALGPHTAAMFQPYLNDTQNRGILNMDAEELFEAGRQAVEGGLSLAVHAIGDRANHEVLDAYEQLRRYEMTRGLTPLRHRIEHVQILHPDDVGRLAEFDIIASMQPVHATSDMEMADSSLGERAAFSYAWQTQVEHGARLAFGSDAPVESPNPFLGLYAGVTRRRANGAPGPTGWYPEQRLSMKQALEGFTLGPAYAGGWEDCLGKIAVGYLADLIVLAQDPLEAPPSELLEMEPVATMVGGEWVWLKS